MLISVIRFPQENSHWSALNDLRSLRTGFVAQAVEKQSNRGGSFCLEAVSDDRQANGADSLDVFGNLLPQLRTFRQPAPQRGDERLVAFA